VPPRPRAWRLRVEDILEAITRIETYTRGMTDAAFVADSKTIDAVVRNLEIIGEASCHIDDEVLHAAPGIPWDKMRGLRNVVAHEYFGVDVGIIWQTVRNDLPPLREPLRRLLEERE
jgi:uncharacterized protein with HEPN domain